MSLLLFFGYTSSIFSAAAVFFFAYFLCQIVRWLTNLRTQILAQRTIWLGVKCAGDKIHKKKIDKILAVASQKKSKQTKNNNKIAPNILWMVREL